MDGPFADRTARAAGRDSDKARPRRRTQFDIRRYCERSTRPIRDVPRNSDTLWAVHTPLRRPSRAGWRNSDRLITRTSSRCLVMDAGAGNGLRRARAVRRRCCGWTTTRSWFRQRCNASVRTTPAWSTSRQLLRNGRGPDRWSQPRRRGLVVRERAKSVGDETRWTALVLNVTAGGYRPPVTSCSKWPNSSFRPFDVP
jgi:hypothetical protein